MRVDQPATGAARPMSPLGAIGWSVLLFMLGQLALALTEAARPGAREDILDQGAYVLFSTSLCIFLIARVHAPEGSLRSCLGLKAVGPLQALLSIGAGAALCPGLSTLAVRILERWPYSEEERQVLEGLSRTPTFASRVAIVVVSLVLIPVAYEVFFRGVLFGQLRRSVPAYVATAVTACCYAGAHDPRVVPLAFVLGVAMARLRERTGSVVAPILAVLGFGAMDAVLVLRGGDPGEDVPYSTRTVILCSALALAALAAIGLGRRRGASDRAG